MLRVRSAVLVASAMVACGDDDSGSKELRDAAVMDAQTARPDAGQADTGPGNTDLPVTADTPTWHRNIAPLLIAKCTGCHDDDSIGPFTISSYASAKPFAKLIASEVAAGTMPPFLAQGGADCEPRLPWLGDMRLNAQQQAMIRSWADHGAPEGDPNTAVVTVPPVPAKLDREDVTMVFPSATIDGSQDVHKCAIVDPGVEQDSFVTNRLVTPGNAKVLQHVVSYLVIPAKIDDPVLGALGARDRTKAENEDLIRKQKGAGIGGSYDCFGNPGLSAPLSVEILDSWAVGSPPNRAPADSGQPIPKNALIVLEAHYRPTGAGAAIDQGTRLGLTITKTQPKYISKTVLIGNFAGTVDSASGTGGLVKQPGEDSAVFSIPANESDHVEEQTWTWKLQTPVKAYGLMPHMQYVGSAMRIWVERKTPSGDDPATECLLETPAWDLNWQRAFSYDATDYAKYPTMANGDVVHFRCTYDNTLMNQALKKVLSDQGKPGPQETRLGTGLLDEMCLGALGIVYPNTAQ